MIHDLAEQLWETWTCGCTVRLKNFEQGQASRAARPSVQAFPLKSSHQLGLDRPGNHGADERADCSLVSLADSRVAAQQTVLGGISSTCKAKEIKFFLRYSGPEEALSKRRKSTPDGHGHMSTGTAKKEKMTRNGAQDNVGNDFLEHVNAIAGLVRTKSCRQQLPRPSCR